MLPRPRTSAGVLVRASFLGIALLGGVAPAVAAPAALPSLPAGAGPNAGGAVDIEQLRRGVVQVEQGGRPMAVGTVLSKDGRVLTSLSALGSIENPEIRYSDNTVVKAKVGHKDKNWDLALLVPQTGKWLDGLKPTDSDPSAVDIKAFLPKGGKLAASAVQLKGRTDARSKDGDPLRGVLDLDFKGLQGIPGAPLLDPDGKVVGVVVRACKETGAAAPSPGGGDKADSGAAPAPPCSPMTIGAPVAALRGFLMKTPTTAVQPAPWLGLGGAPTESGSVKGIRVMGIAPGSPAEKAGLKAAGDNPDTIVAVDGQPVETPEQLADLIGKRSIGQNVKLLVFSQGKFREAAVTLRAAP
ncbi:MAG TPA: S1C family serine protease [Labilithrix sp.]|nr:S1C family serine protease [Labilithrix sp.]